MIDENTPYKLAEIIQDTWPQLYYLKKPTMTFTVYSRDGCPYCDKIQQVLVLSEIKHVIYKLDRDFTREEFYDKFGKGSTFPRVVKDDVLELQVAVSESFLMTVVQSIQNLLEVKSARFLRKVIDFLNYCVKVDFSHFEDDGIDLGFLSASFGLKGSVLKNVDDLDDV